MICYDIILYYIINIYYINNNNITSICTTGMSTKFLQELYKISFIMLEGCNKKKLKAKMFLVSMGDQMVMSEITK